MNQDDFQKIAAGQIEWCQNMLGLKGGDYSRDGDRFHNFKVAAAVDEETPERALWGMWKKHMVSLKDIIDGTAAGKVPTEAVLKEKIGDTINYMLLLVGMIEERRLKDIEAANPMLVVGHIGDVHLGMGEILPVPKKYWDEGTRSYIDQAR